MAWYALRSKPHKEEALWREVGARGYEVYFPFVRVRPVNPRARRIRSYLPGYLFVQADRCAAGSSEFSTMPYAQGLVSFGGEPAEIPDLLVAAIRTRLDQINASGEAAADGHGRRPADFEQGQAVVILDGPFSGCEAIFDAYLSGLDRVRVLLQFLRVNQTKLVLPVSKIQTTNQH